MKAGQQESGLVGRFVLGARMFDFKNPLFRFGLAISVLWLIAAVAVLSCNWVALKPNEWGDVFAGVAAPLAFLWLVLGFVQQGHELQLSTRALKLQAEELKNSVEQQKLLAEATQRQVDAVLEDLALQRKRERDAVQPKLRFSHSGGGSGPQGAEYQFNIYNDGGIARDVRVTFDPPLDPSPFPNDLAVLGPGKYHRTLVLRDKTPSLLITIDYMDSLGNRETLHFRHNLLEPHAVLPV